MAGIGEHENSWGRTTTGCEVVQDLGRTTWALCEKPAVAVGVYGRDGEHGVRRICKAHLSGALRKTTFYADDVTELRTLDGETTHRLERRQGRKGSLRAVEAVG